jgi:hypothetical protein
MEHNRQLTHRPVRTQDFPDFWVLGELRDTHQKSPSAIEPLSNGTFLQRVLNSASTRLNVLYCPFTRTNTRFPREQTGGQKWFGHDAVRPSVGRAEHRDYLRQPAR